MIKRILRTRCSQKSAYSLIIASHYSKCLRYKLGIRSLCRNIVQRTVRCVNATTVTHIKTIEGFVWIDKTKTHTLDISQESLCKTILQTSIHLIYIITTILVGIEIKISCPLEVAT